MTGRPGALAAAAATGIQVGAAMVATRAVVDQAGPASLALLRYAIGVACLAPFALGAARRLRMDRRDLPPIAGLGILQFGILIALLNYGMRSVPAGRAALLFSTFPLMTMALAAVLGYERLSAAGTAGILLTIAGVGLTLGEKALAPGAAGGGWLGEAAVLASALCGAVCSVFYRPYLVKYPTVPVSALAMLASVCFLSIPAAAEGFFTAPPRFTEAGWLAVAFIGVSSGVGYWLWLWALGRAPASRVTMFLALSPVTAAVLGALLLREPLSAPALLGLALVLLGLRVATPRSGRVMIPAHVDEARARAEEDHG